MRTLAQQLTQYAGYHRDRRNIAGHFVGIPAIYFAVVILLSR
ncbi:MAG TPA: Mpo1-like protein, partial [Myxococcaceae bacterium]